MGKIRVKTIGDEETELKDKKNADLKRAEKKARLSAAETTDDGEQSREAAKEQAVVPESTNEVAQTSENTTEQVVSETKPEEKETPKKTKKEKFANKKKARSSKYLEKAMEIDKKKSYSIPEGLEILRKVKLAKFDETVELHVNTISTGISGTMTLPHGNGKEVRIALADDDVLAEVEKGKINFDILIASPSQMPKLAKVAKVLGPRGLMPNPKNGTISDNPEEAMKKFQGGQMSFKTESKNPLIHLSIGKTSYEDKLLEDNIKTVIQAVKKDRIRKITLKSTMSPGISLQI